MRALNAQAAAKVATALERIADRNLKKRQQRDNQNAKAHWEDYRQRKTQAHRMALTKDFRETIRERAQREPRFRKALLREAIELMISGDVKAGRSVLRDYINATVGFRQLEEATSIPANSLMRMFGPNGNPSAKNLFGILAYLQEREGVNFELKARRD